MSDRADLAQVRRSIRESAREVETKHLDDLDRVGAGPGVMAAPPTARRVTAGQWKGEYRRDHSGGYDWFEGLSTAEQKRLRERWFAPAGRGEAPDEIGQRINMAAWLDQTRRADGAGALAEGRAAQFNPKRYGGMNPNSMIEGSPYDVRVIWGDDEKARRHLEKAAGHPGQGRDWRSRSQDTEPDRQHVEFRTRPDGTVYPITPRRGRQHVYAHADDPAF